MKREAYEGRKQAYLNVALKPSQSSCTSPRENPELVDLGNAAELPGAAPEGLLSIDRLLEVRQQSSKASLTASMWDGRYC